MAHESVYLCIVTDAAKTQVAVHATSLSSSRPPSGTPLKFYIVLYNQGDAYSASTGYFVAPVSGVYYFISTIGGADSNDDAHHYLYVDNTQLGVSYTYRDGLNPVFSPVHAVVHLTPGQKVWVKADGSTYLDYHYSMFSGFLLFQDF
jgi:hypothetical protein